MADSVSPPPTTRPYARSLPETLARAVAVGSVLAALAAAFVLSGAWPRSWSEAPELDPVHFIVELLLGIGTESERGGRTPAANAVEIAAWAAVLFSLLAAVGLSFRRALGRSLVSLTVAGLALHLLALLQPGPIVTALTAAAVCAVVWSGRGGHRSQGTTLVDDVMPFREFAGTISLPVGSEPAALFRAFREVTLGELPIASMLGRLRYLPGRLLGRTAAQPPAGIPFFDQLLASGNLVLAESPEREIVIGAIGKFHRLLDQQMVQLKDAAAYRAFGDPACQKLAMSIRVEGAPPRRRLVLEHRTQGLSTGSRWAFAAYWVIIEPMGHLVTWLLLRAVRRRAARPSLHTPGQAPRSARTPA